MTVSQTPVIPNSSGFYVILPLANTVYYLDKTITSGLYVVTFRSGTTLKIITSNNTLYSDSVGITSLTISGNDNILLTASVANTVVLFSKVINDSNRIKQATLDVITSSSNYTQTGTAYAMAIGGGQGGFAGLPFGSGPPTRGGVGGAGGTGGRVITGYINLPGNTPVVVGGPGPFPGGAGGNSSILSLNSSSGVAAAAGTGGAGSVTPSGAGFGNPGSQSPLSNIGPFFVTFGAGGTGGSGPDSRGQGGGIAAGGGGGGGGNINQWGSAGGGGGGHVAGTLGGIGGRGAVCILRF